MKILVLKWDYIKETETYLIGRWKHVSRIVWFFVFIRPFSWNLSALMQNTEILPKLQYMMARILNPKSQKLWIGPEELTVFLYHWFCHTSLVWEAACRNLYVGQKPNSPPAPSRFYFSPFWDTPTVTPSALFFTLVLPLFAFILPL
jgi:hypothetical protein